MINVKDRWFRIASVALPFLITAYTGGLLTNITGTKLLLCALSLCITITVCEGSRYLVYHSNKWFKDNTRLLLVLLIGLVATTIILGISATLRRYILTGQLNLGFELETRVMINNKKIEMGLLPHVFITAFINFSFLLLSYEFFYRKTLFLRSKEEKERLEKEKLKAELSQLKGIVNPHFLFNNLNSLSSLISENPEKAQEFLDELTKVFRYLLRNNQTELTTLSEELKFIRTYYQLLQTRYGSAINMTVQVDEEYNDFLIPPLTLQLLVENAVKHNRLMKDNPLLIEIISAPRKNLLVRNSISKKEGGVESTGIGLQTINARYRMLNREGVLIKNDGSVFSVNIPLISLLENTVQ